MEVFWSLNRHLNYQIQLIGISSLLSLLASAIQCLNQWILAPESVSGNSAFSIDIAWQGSHCAMKTVLKRSVSTFEIQSDYQNLLSVIFKIPACYRNTLPESMDISAKVSLWKWRFPLLRGMFSFRDGKVDLNSVRKPSGRNVIG